MSNFIQLTLTGLANGAILAVAALGFVLIYKATGVINFAQGEFLLIGGYVIWAFTVAGLHWSIAILLALLVAVAMGMLIERLVLRPMVGESAISVIMVTVGLAAVLGALVQGIWGTTQESLDILPASSIALPSGGARPVNRLWAIGIAAVALTIFTVFFRKSHYGVAMRAVADDQQAAMVMGISVRRVFAMSWALAAVSAVIGGLLIASLIGRSSEIAVFGLIVFPVVIVGGLDSILGALVGGLIVGLLSQYTAGYFDPALRTVVPYVILVLVLLVKPYGLFGEERIERV